MVAYANDTLRRLGYKPYYLYRQKYPNEEAVSDYLKCFDALYPYVDYFAVNVSSPNTPNLRALQEKEPLKALLASLMKRNGEKPSPKPILLKIAPDLTCEQLDDIIEIEGAMFET